MLGARGLPATGPGGQRRFALLQRSLSSAEMNVPRGRERERERERERLMDDDVAYLLDELMTSDFVKNYAESAIHQDTAYY